MVRVRKDIDPATCPVSSVTAGHIGLVEDVRVDEDGDTAALLWFGTKIRALRGDSCWIYVENLDLI
jgi:hypothetical protein